MVDRDTDIAYRPIGTVQSPFETPEEVPKNPDITTDAEGIVVIDSEYEDGLTHLEGFSHIGACHTMVPNKQYSPSCCRATPMTAKSHRVTRELEAV